jgi:hypothetical protein
MMLYNCRRASRARSYFREEFFIGSDSGGERAAYMYTQIGTAKLRGANPQVYLQYILERIDGTAALERHGEGARAADRSLTP